MKLADVVATSTAVAATRGRKAKIAALAACLHDAEQPLSVAALLAGGL